MKTIKVQIRNVYGNETVYPACPDAVKFAALCGTKTLTVEKLQTDTLDLSISGAGSVTLTDLTARNLSVSLSGAGNITASGSAQNLTMDISGFGSFRGADLASQRRITIAVVAKPEVRGARHDQIHGLVWQRQGPGVSPHHDGAHFLHRPGQHTPHSRSNRR